MNLASPAGHEPLKSEYDPEKEITRTVMPITVCSSCEHRSECPIERKRNDCRFEFTSKELRLAKCRRYEKTDAFQEKYRKRAGIEATNSGIKQRTGMSRLRVRGKPSVFNVILLKIAGWNILQAARSEKSCEYVRQRVHWNSEETLSAIIEGCLRTIRDQIRSNWRYFQLREKNICWNENNQFRLAI